MAELFKNIYTHEFFDNYARVLSKVITNFEQKVFVKEIEEGDWDDLELKQRMRRISDVLKNHLANDYKTSVEQLIASIDIMLNEEAKKERAYGRLEFIFIPDFIEQNGINDFDTSISAFETITQFISCEFAVRPFIIKYGSRMVDVMIDWTKHKDKNVRRLASEGCRSRLPWAMSIPQYKDDPTPILPILEALKNDSSEYVRKSVANNINDISKDNPELTIKLAKQWKGISKNTDWIIKHACRTLLKGGHQEVLELFGFGNIDNIEVDDFKLKSDSITTGEHLEFEFNIFINSDTKEKIRLEYAIYYMKKNGSLSKKVYKISEKIYNAKSRTHIVRKQSFKLISTRKFHSGSHQISLIINGIEIDVREFQLEA